MLARVALHATDGRVEAVPGISKARWDVTAAELMGADAPRAETLRRRVGVSWEEALEIALTPIERRAQRLGQAARRGNPTAERNRTLMLNALRGLALRLGERPTVLSYEEHRRLFNIKSTRRGGSGVILPCVEVIIDEFGSLEAALQAAGIAQQHSVRRRRQTAEPPEIVLDRFICEHGFLPTRRCFEDWAAATDAPLARNWRPFAELVARTTALRAARGEETPVRATRGTIAVVTPPTALPRRRRPVQRRSDAEIVASVALWAREYLKPGQRPTWRAYAAAARDDERLLYGNVVNRRMPFAEVCRRAGLLGTLDELA